MNQEHTLKLLESEKAKKLLGELYGKAAVAENQKRYEDLVGKFVKEFGEKDLYLFSSPGRTEISGNHTDHQHGCVLAAAVDMQTDAEVRLNGTHLILIDSEGFQPVTVDLDDLSVHEDEKNTTASLVRGVAAAFQARGCKLQGFDAKISSTVLPGSGLSSSAAFEVLIGRILNGLFFENKLSAIEIAQIGQYAENVYFGKPSGLMDQMASSVGGLVFIDFADPKKPVVEKVDFDFAHCGHTLCIIDSHASHADLTDEYAAIPVEMKKVAAFFGKEVLNDVDESAFYASLPALRASCGDRAVLRAMHYFEENQRVRLLGDHLSDKRLDQRVAVRHHLAVALLDQIGEERAVIRQRRGDIV